jgi:thiol-disulfide isomerase/thioredoxin
MISLCLAQGATGAETDQPDATKADLPLDEQLLQSPDDRKLLDEYMIRELRELRRLIQTSPQQAQEHLDAMNEVIQALDPMTEESQLLVDRAKSAIKAQQRRLRLTRLTLQELAGRVLKQPDDRELLSLYRSKLLGELTPLVRAEPDRAQQQMDAARELLAAARDQSAEESTLDALRRIDAALDRLEEMIAMARRRAELIGQDAAPLEVEAWVNGGPLTADDLLGKVVLLDFWAVWCGPCIATFPHLRDWHETYAERGLEIIGVTGYYGLCWDDESGRPRRGSGDEAVTPEQEQEMLARFAEHHQVRHRFAVQKNPALHEYYAVGGIPQVVLIDRAGKVRLIRVGSDEGNAADIAAMLAKLLGDESTAPAAEASRPD